MKAIISIKQKIQQNYTPLVLFKSIDALNEFRLNKNEIQYIKQKIKDNKQQIIINRYPNYLFLYHYKKAKTKSDDLENLRKAAASSLSKILEETKLRKVQVIDFLHEKECFYAFTEGVILADYQFTQLKSKKKDEQLQEIAIYSKKLKQADISKLNHIAEAVYLSRDLVNLPVSALPTPAFAKIIAEKAEESGIKVEIFGKKKLQSLKMGGILSVNQGSIDPPFLACLEWKPKNTTNKKPIVLVGKGIVYDTGGLNIKTGSSMEDMKCDMAGAAAVLATIYAIAKLQLNKYVVALIPATDNRLNGNAYASGDVVKMFDGTTVEVINTDAEGRIILADALAYAKKYDPELLIDVATLTGAAQRAIGSYGIVAMEEKAKTPMKNLKISGDYVYERIAEFPFWSEYEESLQSDIADIKNLGGAEAGMITAGKFLAKFTDYPYIHLDIAGPAFLSKTDSYRKKGGTGIPTRLLIDFIEKNF
ncbi:MAG TPA: leucyl aminopeptidase [Bacteroidetes bacterium]|nr:leucyl aminopeptidase [Bacteroidota bacterium]